jgi:hypothetical protein
VTQVFGEVAVDRVVLAFDYFVEETLHVVCLEWRREGGGFVEDTA